MAEDYRVNSMRGIEFSELRDGREFPYEKRVVGQLYARTFKLSDINDALWMLHELKCDAPLNDFYPSDGPAVMWHYMPILGATIASETFHIEVCNGVIGNWSDDILGPSGAAAPSPTARVIELYQV